MSTFPICPCISHTLSHTIHTFYRHANVQNKCKQVIKTIEQKRICENTHPHTNDTGVEITTCQLAKCEWNLELVSNFFNLLASLASVFPPRFRNTNTHLTRWFMYYCDSHTVMMVYFSSRPSTDKVHTVQMLSKDMILASFSLIWRVKILSYSPVWRVPWKS
jgi:hypothetical protein